MSTDELALQIVPEPSKRTLSQRIANLIGPAIVLVLFIAFWEFMHRWGMRHILDKRPQLLPSLATVINKAFVDGWARWNFEGYEGKGSYAEYHDIVQAMKRLGEDKSHGCGRALWENNGELNKYGTTMSLMLLPFWTNSCIGSMEGLFFEASGTTPYHFLAASAASENASDPVRQLRYDKDKLDLGVRYMRDLGIRYYYAFTPTMVCRLSRRRTTATKLGMKYNTPTTPIRGPRTL